MQPEKMCKKITFEFLLLWSKNKKVKLRKFYKFYLEIWTVFRTATICLKTGRVTFSFNGHINSNSCASKPMQPFVQTLYCDLVLGVWTAAMSVNLSYFRFRLYRLTNVILGVTTTTAAAVATAICNYVVRAQNGVAPVW